MALTALHNPASLVYALYKYRVRHHRKQVPEPDVHHVRLALLCHTAGWKPSVGGKSLHRGLQFVELQGLGEDLIGASCM